MRETEDKLGASAKYGDRNVAHRGRESGLRMEAARLLPAPDVAIIYRAE